MPPVRLAPINHQNQLQIVDTPIVRYGTDGADSLDFDDLVLGEGQYLKIHAGKGNDFVIGSDFRDEIFGESGHDTIAAGGGNDIVHGGAHHDIIGGEYGDDQLFGDDGNDQLFGNEGNDRIFGGTGNDYIDGNEGHDHLEGGKGNDTILGGDGNDHINGGYNSDCLIGGGMADTFFFDAGEYYVWHHGLNETTYLWSMDTIGDFNAAQGDRLDLSSMLRRTTPFTDPAATAADAVSQGYVYFLQHGVPGEMGFGTAVMIDHNGGSHTDGQKTAVFDLLGVSELDLVSLQFISQLIV